MRCKACDCEIELHYRTVKINNTKKKIEEDLCLRCKQLAYESEEPVDDQLEEYDDGEYYEYRQL